MQAWATTADPGRLERVEKARPEPFDDELLARVEACGVCRTDVHIIDGELATRGRPIVPGHQVVGTVVAVGRSVRRTAPGRRVGVAWLRRTCGRCRWCREGRENLCPASEYTGHDRDGGFAEYVTVPEAFAYSLPHDADPASLAPLLCAGIIGYRALDRAALPRGGRLGIYGFGSSAHITAQIALASGAEVFVMTRGEANRDLARAIGVHFVGDEEASPPKPLDSAIVFAPAGNLVPAALKATDRGGTVAVAGIHLSEIPAMDYESNLFYERDLRSVTANTRADGAALLRLARTLAIRPTVTRYPFERVADAVSDLRSGSASGSLVLVNTP
jgi:propanol-preferring alcohol dehydrogenase